jgi:hypothetical protein
MMGQPLSAPDRCSAAATHRQVRNALVRQAQLGASYRVPRPGSWVGSPHRAKPNQQPVPSVARSAESTAKSVNKGREAYTGNTAGRRGDVHPSSDSASLEHHAVGDGFNVPEASTKRSLG